MGERFATTAAAVGASTKLHIVLDGGITLDFDSPALCRDLGFAIRDHYLKVDQTARHIVDKRVHLNAVLSGYFE